MKVSVIIPAYNEEKFIASCLTSIVNQSEPADEIIVVDNNCTDNTIALAKTFPVRVVKQTIQGMIPARNKGFDSAKYEIIARTDADAIVPDFWIQRIKADFEQDPSLVALSGPQQFNTNPVMEELSSWPTVIYFKAMKQAIGHDFLLGPNMAIKKSAWQQIRDHICLDDKIVHEDQDLSLHLTNVGKIRFDNELVILASIRRWKKLKPYFDYPYRAVRTVQRHRLSLHGLTKGKLMVKNASKKFLMKRPIQALTVKPKQYVKKTKSLLQEVL